MSKNFYAPVYRDTDLFLTRSHYAENNPISMEWVGGESGNRTHSLPTKCNTATQGDEVDVGISESHHYCLHKMSETYMN